VAALPLIRGEPAHRKALFEPPPDPQPGEREAPDITAFLTADANSYPSRTVMAHVRRRGRRSGVVENSRRDRLPTACRARVWRYEFWKNV
jgi:hypothetical protein